MASAALLTLIVLTPQVRRPTQAPSREGTARRATRTALSRGRRVTARDIGKTAPRGREAPLLDLALVSNSGISLPYPRYIRKATVLACPSQVRATSPVKRPRLWGSGVRAPVALICQYIDRHKERFAAWPICRVLSDSGTKIAPATALHHTTGHYPPGRSRDHPRSRGVYRYSRARGPQYGGSSPLARGLPGSGGELSGGGGIIPARAGFTQPHRAQCLTGLGSSPLARGLRGDGLPLGGGGRIIPARAGFTQPHRAQCLTGLGSSPLARGLLAVRVFTQDAVRIIPARAGFTG